jgi:integrase
VKVFKGTWKSGLTVPVRTITAGQLQLWVGQHRSRLKNSSTNEYIRFLRQLFALGVNHKVIAESPAASFKQLRLEKPIRATPTWDQFQAIVRNIREQTQNAEAEDSADLVEFMGSAGVGTAECSGLRGEHFDFSRQRIVLYRVKTDQGYEIPMFPQVAPLIEKWRASGRLRVGEPVFRIREPKKSLANACKRLGLPHFSPRSLRRCFVTRAVEKGVDFKTLASWQGHQDGGVLIAKTYSHLRTEHSDRMALKLS